MTTTPTVKFRRVPGYLNSSTYHVDVNGQHVMDVRRISDATWSRTATWRAYRPGADWSVRDRDQLQALNIATESTRERAVQTALRRLAKEA